MILISKTYSEVTPESAEDGEFSDLGFIYEKAETSFRELVQNLREYTETSSYPCKGTQWDWVSTGFEVSDYATGTERSESLHFAGGNVKYWHKALKAAGFVS